MTLSPMPSRTTLIFLVAWLMEQMIYLISLKSVLASKARRVRCSRAWELSQRMLQRQEVSLLSAGSRQGWLMLRSSMDLEECSRIKQQFPTLLYSMANPENKNFDFKSMLDYYINEGVMTLDKQQLQDQIKDLLTILDFLERRIPVRIKFINKRIEDYNSDLAKVKSAIRVITRPDLTDVHSAEFPKRFADENYFPNIDYAYEVYSKVAEFEDLSSEESEQEYEKVAVKAFKLKFLESSGLSTQQKQWTTWFKNTDNRLHLGFKKYQAVVGLKVEENADDYLWCLQSIKDNFTHKEMPFHKEYFNTVVMQSLKDKHGQSAEEHVLAAIFKYMSFIEMMEFRTILQRVAVKEQVDGEEVFRFVSEDPSINLLFKFSDPQTKDESMLTITRESETPLKMKLWWRENCLAGEIAYSDIDLKLKEGLENINPKELIDMMIDLCSLTKTYDKLKKRSDHHKLNLMKDFMHWQVANYHWYYDLKNSQNTHYTHTGNGIYLTDTVDTETIVVRVTESGKFESNCGPNLFIEGLIKNLENLKIMFIYLDLIRTFSIKNNTDGCEIDDFGVNQTGVWIDFKQKIVYEDAIIKSVKGQTSADDKSQFTSMGCMVEFDLTFTQLNISSLHTGSNPPREPTRLNIESQESARWRKYWAERKNPEERLKVAEVKDFVNSIRHHYIIKRIYERRLQEPNRSLFHLSF